MDIIESQTRQMYDLLRHDGYFTQVHCHNLQTGRVISRELLGGKEKVISWAKEVNGRGNCFVGKAARDKDGNVVHTSCLSLDIDAKKPKGEASTQAQWETAIQAGRSVIRAMAYGILCSSGNGALVLFPLREPLNKEASEAMGKKLEEMAREILKGVEVNVDATFDIARLAKLMGTLSTKGDPSLQRTARFLETGSDPYKGHDGFLANLTSSPSPVKAQEFVVPPIEQGTLDRSKLDISLATRLKLQGFSAEDTYKALCSHASREDRPDDYKRIVEKLYFGRGSLTDMVSGGSDGKELQLWTPESGLDNYRNRQRPGKPELPTGFAQLDAATFGLQRGHIFTVGARTNCGKTTFAVTITANLCRAGKKVLFISTETQFHEIWDRYIAVSTDISAFKLQNGLVSTEGKGRVEGFLSEFKSHPFYVYDGSRPSIQTVRQAVTKASPDVLVFDYFQHVEGRETKELEEFVMQIKEMAKELNVAVLMCAQLHDGYPNPKTGKIPSPSMRDIKNCKALNDESKVVVLLDWDRDAISGDGAASVRLILAKNKGKHQDCELRLDRSIPKFVEA